MAESPPVRVVRLDLESMGQDPEYPRALLFGLLDGGDVRLAVDLSSVEYFDSTVLGTLIRALRHAHTKGGDLRLFGLNRFAERMFRGGPSIFRIFEGEAEAIDSFDEQPPDERTPGPS